MSPAQISWQRTLRAAELRLTATVTIRTRTGAKPAAPIVMSACNTAQMSVQSMVSSSIIARATISANAPTRIHASDNFRGPLLGFEPKPKAFRSFFF